MMLSEDVLSIVDAMDHKAKSRRASVLRATDVVPPFDERVPPADRTAGAERPDAASSEAQVPPGPAVRPVEAVNGNADGARQPPARDVDVPIPSYDLAETILAEQRRVAAGRRRAPGRPEEEPTPKPEDTRSRISIAELSSQDLVELQRIVTEIVARDIERLCRRPDPQPHAGPR